MISAMQIGKDLLWQLKRQYIQVNDEEIKKSSLEKYYRFCGIHIYRYEATRIFGFPSPKVTRFFANFPSLYSFYQQKLCQEVRENKTIKNFSSNDILYCTLIHVFASAIRQHAGKEKN